MFLELKDYKLRFIKNEQATLRQGINVGLNNHMPTSKVDFGYIETVRGIGTGLDYGVREMSDNEIHWHHFSTIQSIVPVLVSNEKIGIDDYFYLDSGEIRKCTGVMDEVKRSHSTIYDEYGQWHFCGSVKKVIATADQIGFAFNWGPPHAHNHDWKYDEDLKKYTYLEDYLPSMLHRSVRGGCKLRVVVEEVCPNYNGAHIGKDCSCKSGFIVRPKIRNGKVIMDTYGFLNRKEGYYFH